MLQKAPWVPMSDGHPLRSNHLYIKTTFWSEHLKTTPLSPFLLALSILLALQTRTKKRRPVPNTNKDHIFST